MDNNKHLITITGMRRFMTWIDKALILVQNDYHSIIDGLASIIVTKEERWDAKYDKPSDGIPKTDLEQSVQLSLGNADNAVQKMSYATTIPSTGMKANTFYELGTITADPNITIRTPPDSKCWDWRLSFKTNGTPPASVTFPSNVRFPFVPSFGANKYYEIDFSYSKRDSIYYAVIQSWDNV